jgi:transposase
VLLHCIEAEGGGRRHDRSRSGYSGKHKRVGVKASFVVDATGLPVSAVIASGNAHDVSLAEDTVSRIRGYDYFRAIMLADKGYDSKKFRKFTFNLIDSP